jgi:hypothetical protein
MLLELALSARTYARTHEEDVLKRGHATHLCGVFGQLRLLEVFTAAKTSGDAPARSDECPADDVRDWGKRSGFRMQG